MIKERIKELNVSRVVRLKESPNSRHKDAQLALVFSDIVDSIQIVASEPDHYPNWSQLLLAKALILTHGRQPDSSTLTIIGDVTTTLGADTPLRKLKSNENLVNQITKQFEPLPPNHLVTMTEDAGIFMSLRGKMLPSAIRTSFCLPSDLLKDPVFVEALVSTTPQGANPLNIPGGIDGVHAISRIAETNQLRELKLTNLFRIAPEVIESLTNASTTQYLDFFTEQRRVTKTMLNHLGSETTVAMLLSAYNFHPTLILRMLETLVKYDQSSNKRTMLPTNLIGFQD